MARRQPETAKMVPESDSDREEGAMGQVGAPGVSVRRCASRSAVRSHFRGLTQALPRQSSLQTALPTRFPARIPPFHRPFFRSLSHFCVRMWAVLQWLPPLSLQLLLLGASCRVTAGSPAFSPGQWQSKGVLAYSLPFLRAARA